MRVGFEGKVLMAQAGGTGRYAINLPRALLVAPPSLTERDRERFSAAKSSLIRTLALIPAALHREHIDTFPSLAHGEGNGRAYHC